MKTPFGIPAKVLPWIPVLGIILILMYCFKKGARFVDTGMDIFGTSTQAMAFILNVIFQSISCILLHYVISIL